MCDVVVVCDIRKRCSRDGQATGQVLIGAGSFLERMKIPCSSFTQNDLNLDKIWIRKKIIYDSTES